MRKVRVSVEYDEQSAKWEVFVYGCESPLEAKQAFAAVCVTLGDVVQFGDEHVVKHKSGYEIQPVVLQ